MIYLRSGAFPRLFRAYEEDFDFLNLKKSRKRTMTQTLSEDLELFCTRIPEEQEGERVDKCIASLIGSLSRSFIQKMIKEGRVSVNGVPVKASCQLRRG